MAVVWKLSHNGGPLYPLATWKIDRLTRTRRNLAVSEVKFSTTPPTVATGIYGAPAFVFGDTIRIYRGAVCWFVGTVSHRSVYGARQGERFHYTVSDAWWKLERIIYQQPYTYKAGTPPATLSMGLTGKVVLGKDQWGKVITQSAQITKICTFAGVFSSISIPTLITGYFIEATDITCAEAIRRMLAITPDCVGWVSYSTGAPVFNLRRRGVLSISNVDLADVDQVEVIEIGPREDLLIDGVQFIYLTMAEDASGRLYMQRTVDGAGAAGGESVIIATIELAAQGTTRPEEIPSGLAANYYSARNVLQWEGAIKIRDRDSSDAVPLGTALNLINGDDSWATMNAMIQSVEENIFTGESDVTFGPAAHLGELDFISLMNFTQKKNPASDFPEKQDNGTEGVSGENGGEGSDPSSGSPEPNPSAGKPSSAGGSGTNHQSVPITHCVDGVEQIDNVVKAL